jgi:hypothetical protein
MWLATKTYWLTDRQSNCDFDFDFDFDLTDSSVGGVVWLEVESVQSKIVLCEM